MPEIRCESYFIVTLYRYYFRPIITLASYYTEPAAKSQPHFLNVHTFVAQSGQRRSNALGWPAARHFSFHFMVAAARSNYVADRPLIMYAPLFHEIASRAIFTVY